ncbi:MAG: hypothetical protein ABIJ08_04435, partial [Nanoarchaeota archaeon]
MGLKKIIDKLHPLERKVLPLLDRFTNFDDIVSQSKLKDVEVMRALQWLENKEVIKLHEEIEDLVNLSKNGQGYIKDGLPEKRFLLALGKKTMTMDQIRDKSGITKEELNVCLGVLRKKAAIIITKEKNELVVKALDNAQRLLEGGFLEESFLEKKFPIILNTLKA